MSESDWSNLYLIINVLLWVFTFVIYQYKTRYFGVGSAILMFYMCISIVDIHLYNNQLYPYQFKELSLFPFIYLYFMIIVISMPILIINERKIKFINSSSSLFNIVCVMIVLFSLVGLPKILPTIRENLLYIILDSDVGLELYQGASFDYTSKTKSGLDIFSILTGTCGKISIVFLFYYLTLEKKSKFILIGLIISSISGPIYSISSGSRAEMAQLILNSIIMFIFIRNMLPVRLKKKIIMAFFVFMISLIIPFLAITLSRKEGDLEKAIVGVESYIAQGPLHFNNYGLDAGGIRYGDYTIVAFKYMLGLDPAMYFWGRVNRYSHMKLNESLFYTFVGDFTLDYGPELTILIFIILSFLFVRYLSIKGDSISFNQFLIFYLLATSCLGYFQFPYGRESGNVNLMVILLLSIVFGINRNLKRM